MIARATYKRCARNATIANTERGSMTNDERLEQWHLARVEIAVVQLYDWYMRGDCSKDVAIRQIDGETLDKIFQRCFKNLR